MGENKNYAAQDGLLFYLSGENGNTADFAKGPAAPTFWDGVEIKEGGVGGKFFECGNEQLMAYRAPGNIYAQRGSLSFFWRSRYPVGMTAFPIFRVAFADHSSWDQVFLRIDYNGQQQGIDAFVTDINLARTRVSSTMHPFPKADEWLHIGFSWDENVGVKLYLNGYLVEQRLEKKVYFAGLDQFGPHSRIISNWNVQSRYNFMRGGDIDEIRIYDRMLSDENMLQLSKNEIPTSLPGVERPLSESVYREEWLRRNGWDQAVNQPKYYPAADLSVRKVEIHDAYDLKRWWYKSTDGIRETTWPGVFNRSRLSGRNDYFQLPDWDCYYYSGKAITYHMPDEPWNHLEISGSAFGSLYLVDGEQETELDTRARYLERSVHTFEKPVTGKKVKFVNTLIEEPIGDFSAFYVSEGKAPQGVATQTYYLDGNVHVDAADGTAGEVAAFVRGRYLPDERVFMVGAGEKSAYTGNQKGLPMVHVAVAYDNKEHLGLDGVSLEIPALNLAPTSGEYLSLNIQIKDPSWVYRNLANFTILLKPGEAKTIWFDLRDRIIPEDKALYLTLSCSAEGFGPACLQGAKLEMVYKSQADALEEFCADRLVQVRDIHGHLVEERPGRKEFNLYNRFMSDLTDIARYNPEHRLAQEYLWDCLIDVLGNERNKGSDALGDIEIKKPSFEQPKAPAGAEEWAHKQVAMIDRFKYVTDWWIENRQIEDGELGGGLSDDGDQTGTWTALYHMGFEPEKYKESLFRETDEFYNQGMFLDGLGMIQTDYLHSFEEGIQALCQCVTLEPGNPKYFERAMETARAMFRITEKNRFGERLFISSMYSGIRVSREAPWNLSHPHSYLVTGPAIAVTRYNGNPLSRQLLIELADALLNHYYDGVMHAAINFDTGEDSEGAGPAVSYWSVLMSAYRSTGDEKYLIPLQGGQVPYVDLPSNKGKMDKEGIAALNAAANEKMALREFINTDGQVWSDRLVINIKDAQYQRLGGVNYDRNCLYPMNFVTWKFATDADAELVGINIPYGRTDELKVIVNNFADHDVAATMLGYEVDPGVWAVTCGVDTAGNDVADADCKSYEAAFENYTGLDFVFPKGKNTVITLKRVKAGTPYWERCDLGICEDDVTVSDGKVQVVVHGMGAVDSPAATAVLRNPAGAVVCTAGIPAMAAPNDLYPKTATVEFKVEGCVKGYTVEIDPDNKLCEINKQNNVVTIR